MKAFVFLLLLWQSSAFGAKRRKPGRREPTDKYRISLRFITSKFWNPRR